MIANEGDKMKIFKGIMVTVVSVLGLAQAAQADTDFSTAAGTVLIAAPTALNGPTNQGIWFINPSNKMFSLSLPALPGNQAYEGWVVDNCTGKKFSTGLFRADGKTDSDAAGLYAGPLALDYPPVAGSDFVTVGQSITDGGHIVVVTVEPYPDTDPNPSGFVVLRGSIPEDVMVGTEITLANVAQ